LKLNTRSPSWKKPFAKYGQPEIVNSDQGSQFTSEAFTDAVLGKGIMLSMDSKGSRRDKRHGGHRKA
jgi:putative transposase